MASVTQCDVCGNIVKHQEGVFVRIDAVTAQNDMDKRLATLDICPQCKAKLFELLKLEK